MNSPQTLTESTGARLYRRAKTLIPGGTQLLSKRPEMFLPEQWPSYYSKAQGVEVWDLDGNRYVDMSIMGVGACILGYADPDVDAAVARVIANGSACTLNAPEEVELAELLCELHPWADMVRYARSGGEAVSVAVRIARAHTRRDVVAFSGYHGWTDFYLAANLAEDDALDGHLMPGLDPNGVPRSLRGTAVPFHYNQLEEFKAIVRQHGSNLAAIVMEPRRDNPPEPGFLESVRTIASEIGAVLIFDEITSGFRMTTGGAHLLMGVEPDLAVFAKGMANGYAISAIVGRGEVMQAAQSTFISSTNWTERIGPTAALATIRKHRDQNVIAHITRIGNQVMDGWNTLGHKHRLPLHASGLPSLAHFGFDHPQEVAMRTYFVQEMLKRGYLAFHQFKPSLAHQPSHVEAYLRAADEVLGSLARALAMEDLNARLEGPAARQGFYRLT